MTTKKTPIMHGPGAPMYLAIGQNVWGRGLSAVEALHKMRGAGDSENYYVIEFPHDVDPWVGDIGTINYYTTGLPDNFDVNDHIVASVKATPYMIERRG